MLIQGNRYLGMDHPVFLSGSISTQGYDAGPWDSGTLKAEVADNEIVGNFTGIYLAFRGLLANQDIPSTLMVKAHDNDLTYNHVPIYAQTLECYFLPCSLCKKSKDAVIDLALARNDLSSSQSGVDGFPRPAPCRQAPEWAGQGSPGDERGVVADLRSP